jgi:hypothetical protein
MSTRFGEWVRSLFGTTSEKAPGEQDTERDHNVARTRSTGGDADTAGGVSGDSEGTTGPGENETFVGRVAGNDDVGAVGETGAEARARNSDDGR